MYWRERKIVKKSLQVNKLYCRSPPFETPQT